jgi:predicted nuclease of predicted toxin-antitoxin system
MSDVRYYLDENMSPHVEQQLLRHSIDVVSVLSLDLLGEDDLSHLKRATEMGRVICTHDTDFLRLSKDNWDHAGILWMPHEPANLIIGAWVRHLLQIHQQRTAENMRGVVQILSVK